MTESCIECGQSSVSERIAPVVHHVGRREVLVENDRHLYCAVCGNITYFGDMLDENQKAIAVKIRQEDNLLSPDELRTIRLKYGFTQAEMEKLLTIGPKTWVRWERGKIVQSSTADQMIRQVAKNPSVLRDLMNATGVHNKTAEEVLASIDKEVEAKVAERLRPKFPDFPPEVIEEMARVAAAEVRSAQNTNCHREQVAA